MDISKVVVDKSKVAKVKVESALLEGALKYCMEQGFTHVVPPHLTRATGACENIDTHYETDHFGRKAFLSQTGQLFLEAFISSLGGVYCVGPSFRAEGQVDDRHLCEFTLFELEFPTYRDESMEELTAHIEGIMMKMINNVLSKCRHEMAFIDRGHLAYLETVRAPFTQITYSEAINILKHAGIDITWGDDLKAKHEQYLSQCNDEMPLLITHYPQKIKFFNMQPSSQNPKIVNSCDLILPNAGECAGAACRIHDAGQLKERLVDSDMMRQLREKGVSQNVFKWYVDVVEGHGIPHAGFGLGMSRIMQWIINSNNIRECTAFPVNAEVIY